MSLWGVAFALCGFWVSGTWVYIPTTPFLEILIHKQNAKQKESKGGWLIVERILEDRARRLN
jgi:hypothetical protein